MLSNEYIQRLVDIAGAAAHGGLVRQARVIYEGVLAAQPQNASALVGKAFTHIVTDDFAAAKVILKDQVLAANADDMEALALLGLAHALAGEAEDARVTLEQVHSDGPAGAMAQQLLADL